MSPPHSPTDAPAGVVDLDTLLAKREGWRAAGLTVVWTNGSFDLLHVGHVRNLQGAAALGDVLIVGVNSDASVRRRKVPHQKHLHHLRPPAPSRFPSPCLVLP